MKTNDTAGTSIREVKFLAIKGLKGRTATASFTPALIKEVIKEVTG